VSDEEFDLNRVIEERLDADTCDPEPMGDTPFQALAVLIEADLTDSEKEQAIAQLIAERLAQLSAEEMSVFVRIAREDGEGAAMAFLGSTMGSL
jgi:hypothetical protein